MVHNLLKFLDIQVFVLRILFVQQIIHLLHYMQSFGHQQNAKQIITFLIYFDTCFHLKVLFESFPFINYEYKLIIAFIPNVNKLLIFLMES